MYISKDINTAALKSIESLTEVQNTTYYDHLMVFIMSILYMVSFNCNRCTKYNNVCVIPITIPVVVVVVVNNILKQVNA